MCFVYGNPTFNPWHCIIPKCCLGVAPKHLKRSPSLIPPKETRAKLPVLCQILQMLRIHMASDSVSSEAQAEIP